MTKVAKLALTVVAGVVLAYFVIAVLNILGWNGSHPRLPPLLRKVTDGGGYSGPLAACPYRPAGLENLPLALSPELTERLQQEFPAGSSGGHLGEVLSQMGFSLLPPCNDDPSIGRAEFKQSGGPYPLSAWVFWKVDDHGTIVWTKGVVRYIGL